MVSPPQSSSSSDRRGGNEWAAHSEDDDARIIHEKSAWKRFVLRYRVIEFACTAVMFGFSLFFSLIDVFERPIPNVEVRISANNTVFSRDPSINYKKMDEQVPMAFLIGAGCGVPVLTNLFLNYVLPKVKRVRVIPHDTRDFLLSLFQSAGLSQLLTQFMKNMTGRFRPCFYDMCGWQKDIIWDGVTNLCTSAKWEKEARKSFPSGHSSFAWSTMLVLTLYLLGRSRLNCENRSESILRGGRKSLKLFMCFVPSFFAAWVAVTRSVDNWHHYTDIVTGSIIGAVAACIGYGYNYGSVFNWETAGVPYQECHNRRKVRMHVLQEQRRLLLQKKQLALQSGGDTSSIHTTIIETESEIRKDRELLEASSSMESNPIPGHASGVSHSQPQGLLHKPMTTSGEHVINVNSRSSVSGSTAHKPFVLFELFFVEELLKSHRAILERKNENATLRDSSKVRRRASHALAALASLVHHTVVRANSRAPDCLNASRGARRGRGRGGSRQQPAAVAAAPQSRRQQQAYVHRYQSSSESEEDDEGDLYSQQWLPGSGWGTPPPANRRPNDRRQQQQWDSYASEAEESVSEEEEYDSDDYEYGDFVSYHDAEFNYGPAATRTAVRANNARSNQYGHGGNRRSVSAPVAAQPKPPPPALCRFYVLGKCRYGSHCTYSHEIPAAATTECEMTEEDSLTAAAALVDCPYFLRGNCKYGQHCRLRHTPPLQAAATATRSQGPSVASAASVPNNQTSATGDAGTTEHEYTCGVCFDDVVESGKHFGLLSCDHCFCLDCLRSWRQSKDMDAEVTRSCPACRLPSNYIVPSLTFCTGEEKQNVVDAYKSHLSVRECKYFNGMFGSCPFGPHCFYAHRNAEGEDIKHLDRPRRNSKHRHGNHRGDLPSNESLSSLLTNYGSLFRFLESLDWDDYDDYDEGVDAGWE